MRNHIEIEGQLDSGLRKFEERVKGSGLIIWARMLRKKFSEFVAALKAKDKAAYSELMQLEITAKEIKDSEQSAKILNRIYKLKGIVGALCLSLLCFNTLNLAFNGFRTIGRGGSLRGVSIHRIVRKREVEA